MLWILLLGNFLCEDPCAWDLLTCNRKILVFIQTVLAHGVHLEDSELEILKNRRTSIIHCPTSNTCLRSGLCDVKRLRSQGVNIGLGTDVAGGHSVSILDVMRSAIQVSTHIAFSKEAYEPMNYVDVFHLATLGGAKGRWTL